MAGVSGVLFQCETSEMLGILAQGLREGSGRQTALLGGQPVGGNRTDGCPR